MPIIPFQKMMNNALQNKYAVGYFEAWNLDALEAILGAAEELRSPIILGFGGKTVNLEWFRNNGLEYQAAIGREASKRSEVPICLILNEIDFDLCLRGIELGFNTLMMDAEGLDIKEYGKKVKELVNIAHDNGVGVEAELGHLPESDNPEEGVLTDPLQAGQFVQETGIDALSVSIGNIHTSLTLEAKVDFDRLGKIQTNTHLPLVIHGGTSFPKGKIQECLQYGVAKFNFGTILKKVYLDGIIEEIRQLKGVINIQSVVGSHKSTDFTGCGKELVKQKVKEYILVLGSAGKA